VWDIAIRCFHCIKPYPVASDLRLPKITVSSPSKPDELPELRISISVLSLFRRVENLEDILVGREGLLVVRSGRRGLLLPQVASDRGWDRETFLDAACRKAGLPNDAWRAGDVEVFAFQAEVFFEDETELESGAEVVVRV